ncbi:hypothetical protein ACFVS2_20175 [Brevibacillus sp. NPDC058079]|uniref:hypothetical protein n=1 Tax=Brevibacillus sp. NPDC058079 TaxID=3346330 RepID=UPI0036E622E1
MKAYRLMLELPCADDVWTFIESSGGERHSKFHPPSSSVIYGTYFMTEKLLKKAMKKFPKAIRKVEEDPYTFRPIDLSKVVVGTVLEFDHISYGLIRGKILMKSPHHDVSGNSFYFVEYLKLGKVIGYDSISESVINILSECRIVESINTH